MTMTTDTEQHDFETIEAAKAWIAAMNRDIATAPGLLWDCQVKGGRVHATATSNPSLVVTYPFNGPSAQP